MQKSIILLHGALGASDYLKPLADYLSQPDFEVFTLNFSGHGKSPFQTSFSIEQFSEELKLFIAENNLKKPNVFGYSMGGYVALYLASQQKGLLGNIITLGTKLDWNPEGAQREIKLLEPKTIIEKVPKFAEALKIRHGHNWELLLQKTAEMMLSLGNNNILNAQTFSKIESKVLMGLADSDSMVTVAETDNAASQIENSKRFTLENTKHPIETVDVNVLARIIKQNI